MSTAQKASLNWSILPGQQRQTMDAIDAIRGLMSVTFRRSYRAEIKVSARDEKCLVESWITCKREITLSKDISDSDAARHETAIEMWQAAHSHFENFGLSHPQVPELRKKAEESYRGLGWSDACCISAEQEFCAIHVDVKMEQILV